MANANPLTSAPGRRFGVRDLPGLLATAPGRRTLAHSALKTARPALQLVAMVYRRTVLAGTPVIAVVGSFGKTTTTHAIVTALPVDADRYIRGNNESDVSIHLLARRSGAEPLVYECGIDRPGRMRGFARLVRPSVVVVTSIGSEHNQSLGTLENTRHEKAFMVRALPDDGVAILNADDANVMWMASQTDADIVTYGFAEHAHVRATAHETLDAGRSRLQLRVAGGGHTIDSELLGIASARAVLAALAVARARGVPTEEAAARLQDIKPVARRLQRFRTPDGLTLISDEFKSPVETIVEALDALAATPGRRRIAVLGQPHAGSLKTGDWARGLGARAAAACDAVLFVGSSRTLKPLRGAAASAGMSRNDIRRVPDDPAAIVAAVRELAGPGDVVLFKGRETKLLERAKLVLLGHEVRCTRTNCRLRRSCTECELLTVD